MRTAGGCSGSLSAYPPGVLADEVRRHCAAIAGSARSVRIDLDAAAVEPGKAGLDPMVHLMGGDPEPVARYILILDAINFGSGWFHELDDNGHPDVCTRMAWRLTEHARLRDGEPWEAAEMQAIDAAEVAAVLGQDPDHTLMGLYARALCDLGEWLGERSALQAIASRSAQGLAARLTEMEYYADRGFYKRAQITVNDLVLAGVAEFPDIDELTIFADNLVPHVLRVDGVLEYEPGLAARIDAGEELPAGSREETEIRACAVHACDSIARGLGVPARTLDNWLWNRGLEPRYAADGRRPHRTRTVFY